MTDKPENKRHGGARKGAGRPSKDGPSVMRRIPVWLADALNTDPDALEKIKKAIKKPPAG